MPRGRTCRHVAGSVALPRVVLATTTDVNDENDANTASDTSRGDKAEFAATLTALAARPAALAGAEARIEFPARDPNGFVANAIQGAGGDDVLEDSAGSGSKPPGPRGRWARAGGGTRAGRQHGGVLEGPDGSDQARPHRASLSAAENGPVWNDTR